MKGREAHNFIFKEFIVGPLDVNCYIIADPATKEACIVDPGAEPEMMMNFLRKEGLNLKFIINTHGHGDHIAANSYFKVPIYIHRLDQSFLQDGMKNLSSMLFFTVSSPKASRLLEDGDVINLGGLNIRVIHTPGHTPGSISLKLNGVILTGDALFKGGVGRTDFEYGDQDALLKSIREKLLAFGDDTIIYPGHGDSSTLGEEKRTNPFL